MRKTICDGCGYDLTDIPHAVCEAQVMFMGGSATKNVELTKTFDLCADCRDKLRRQLPDKWARIEPTLP